MADRHRFDSRQPAGSGRLEARLRRESRAGRPAFSAALHDRVMAGVATDSARRITEAAERLPPARPSASLGGIAVALAGVAVAIGGIGGWFSRGPWVVPEAAAVAVAEIPGIERLPTPGEIGEGVLAEVTMLAADAVGVPALRDFAGFGSLPFATADDGGQ